jgi:hypothetical protein
MEAGIVAGFQEMTKFMNHNMFHTPLRQQQQIDRKADASIPDIAHTPTGNHRFIKNQ